MNLKTLRSRRLLLVLALIVVILGGFLCLLLPLNFMPIPLSLILFVLMTIVVTISTGYIETFTVKEIHNNVGQVESFISLNAIIKPRLPLPPLRNSAISPDMANLLASAILREKPKKVVECGSGVSTVIAAYCLERNSLGHIWSLDHEEKYAKITEGNLIAHGLERYSTVLHAPLKEYSIHGRKKLFYDLRLLANTDKIDILFIDGPPRTIDPMIRHLALPLFFKRFNSDALVIIDDAARPAERQIIESWRQQFPELIYEWFDTEKGTVFLRKSSN